MCDVCQVRCALKSVTIILMKQTTISSIVKNEFHGDLNLDIDVLCRFRSRFKFKFRR